MIATPNSYGNNTYCDNDLKLVVKYCVVEMILEIGNAKQKERFMKFYYLSG